MSRAVANLRVIAAAAGGFQLALMLIVVTVQAKQFPVAAIGWVVVVIVVPMMDRQLAQVGAGEFARAAAADPGIDLERLFAIALPARLGVAASLGQYPVELSRIACFHSRWPPTMERYFTSAS